MPDDTPPTGFDIEALLVHRQWVSRVARSLVHGSADAEDLEQVAWTRILEHPPAVPPRSPRAWLRQVLRFNSVDRGRAERTRRRHEEAAAAVDRSDLTPDAVVARAELMDRLVHAVLALEEPYRSTVLLRHFEDLAPAAIAQRQGVPVETVRTRLKRALAQLRERMEVDSGGDRRAWVLALAPLLRAPGGGAGPEAPVATVGAVATATGVLIMGAKAKVALAVIVVVVLGWFAWRDPVGIEAGAGDRRHRGMGMEVATSPSSAPGLPSAGPTPSAETADEGTPAASPVVPVPERTVRVEGRVLAPDGTPIPGASVREVDEDGRFRSVAISDATGSYRWSGDGERVSLSATAAGFGVGPVMDVGCPKKGVVHVDLSLGLPPGILRGRVVDGEGRPVVGASVRMGGPRDRGMRPRPGPGEILQRIPLPRDFTTDGEGVFVVDELPPGTVELVTRSGSLAQRYDMVSVESARETDFEIRLTAGGTLVGVLRTPDGGPAEGAEIQVLALGGNLRTRTAADGSFRIPLVPEGKATVLVREDAGQAEGEFEFVSGEEVRWDATLDRRSVIRGRVLDEAGEPLAGWTVGVCQGELEIGHTVRATTDAAGRFACSVLAGGDHFLWVAPGYPRLPVITRRGVRPGTGDLELQVSAGDLPSARVRGRVVDQSGAPSPDVFVQATVGAGRPAMSAMEVEWVRGDEETGAFDLGPLPPGTVDLDIRSAAVNGSILRRRVTLARDEVLDLGTVVQHPGGRLILTFAPEKGVIEVGAQYFVERVDGGPGPAEFKFGDATGEVRLTLPAGKWRARVQGNFEGSERAVEVESGGEIRVTLPLRRAPLRWFRLHGPGATTNGRFLQYVIRDEEGWQVAAGNLARGKWADFFTTAMLREGVYEVRARLEDGSEARVTVRLGAGEGGAMEEAVGVELR